ncbi:MAG: hypothetical protein FJ279_28795 [Planctomycetes bacterium]|nr:hypothetical protein [Planctomycetota bacterium]
MVAVSAVAFGEPVNVLLRETREKLKEPERDPKLASRVGFERVERHLSVGNARFWLRQTFEPGQPDGPVVKQYGDFFFGLEFGRRGNGQWDVWHFLQPRVLLPNEKAPVHPTRARPPMGFFPLEQGKRGLADMVWPAGEAGGAFTIRAVKLPDDPQWLYLEVSVDSPGATLDGVAISAYPCETTGPPERERWISSAVAGHLMTNQRAPINPATEWALCWHNKRAQEDWGVLSVFDPEEVAGAAAFGTYGVALELKPKPNRATLRLAVGYFKATPYAEALAALGRDADGLLRRLRTLRWTLDMANMANIERELSPLNDLLRHKSVEEKFGVRWREAANRIAALKASKQLTRAEERELAALLHSQRVLRDEMYATALEALIREMP